MAQVTIRNYTGRNTPAHRVEIGDLVLYFSYETCVAFRSPDRPGVTVITNLWGPTTGRHLNEIDGGNKKARLSCAAFHLALDEVLARIHITS